MVCSEVMQTAFYNEIRLRVRIRGRLVGKSVRTKEEHRINYGSRSRTEEDEYLEVYDHALMRWTKVSSTNAVRDQILKGLDVTCQ